MTEKYFEQRLLIKGYLKSIHDMLEAIDDELIGDSLVDFELIEKDFCGSPEDEERLAACLLLVRHMYLGLHNWLHGTDHSIPDLIS